MELNTPAASSDRYPEEHPEGVAPGLEQARQLGCRGGARNDRRVRIADEANRLGGGGKPLKGESRTWLRGETDPRSSRRSKPSRA